jgi:prepilin-type N-terminal cleavage/methylation domain-containing protein
MKNKKCELGFSLIELSIVILVIGLLVIGITQGKRIISRSRISSAKSLTTSSPVASINNLVLWLETTSDKSFDNADKIDGGSGVNGTIATWYNINPQGVNLRNVSQGTASQKTNLQY